MTSFELLTVAALLLSAAALLLGRRKSRITMEHSPLTDELIVCLARVASAVEALRGPSEEEITRNVLVRLHEIANAKPKPSAKVREMPSGSGSFPRR
ncbi:MAG TPA: hypothetical protein VMU53_07390 [Candidatus Sulfotelmatobacter sp.]|nr:hypothetical protein [Candidatus Sulfotelmatobacter sp.]